MTHDELIAALRRLKVETGSLACLGCGHEHNCSTQGCAILREAVKTLTVYLDFLECRFVKPGDPDFPLVALVIPKFADRDFLKLGNNYFMPLFQVVDVVLEGSPEVIRCRECKYYKQSPTLAPQKFCYRLRAADGSPVGYNWHEDEFCSRGVRREEDGET